MTAPTAPTVAPVVTGTVETPSVGMVFPVGRLVFLGLVGMVGALVIVLFQVLHERDELRKAYTELKPAAHTPNGKYDGPVSPATATDTVEASPNSDTSEV